MDFVKKNLTNILLFIVVFLLLIIIFRDKIGDTFRTIEVLNRADRNYIPQVAKKCKPVLVQDDDEKISSDVVNECLEMHDLYAEDIQRWRDLINENREIDCKDFEDQKDAQGFFNYISGEATMVFTYQTKSYVEKWDGKCHYDPYNLDADGNCNACEGL